VAHPDPALSSNGTIAGHGLPSRLLLKGKQLMTILRWVLAGSA